MKIINIGMFPCNNTFKRKAEMTFRDTRKDKGIGENSMILGICADEEIIGLGVELNEKVLRRFIQSGRGPRFIGRKR